MSHVYAKNGQVVNVLTGEEGCLHCVMPKANAKAHTDPPQVTAEQQAHDAAVLGEHEEDDA
jgi:hypothetical protein